MNALITAMLVGILIAVIGLTLLVVRLHDKVDDLLERRAASEEKLGENHYAKRPSDRTMFG